MVRHRRKSLDISINANHYLGDMSIATSSSPVAPSYFSYYVQNSAPEVATNLGNFTAELWPLSGTKSWRLDINGAQLRRLCDSIKISPFKHFLCGKCLKTLFVQLSSVYKKSNLTLDPPRRSWEVTKKWVYFVYNPASWYHPWFLSSHQCQCPPNSQWAAQREAFLIRVYTPKN